MHENIHRNQNLVLYSATWVSNSGASLAFAFDQEGLGVIRSNISIARPWQTGKPSVYRDPYHLFPSTCDKDQVPRTWPGALGLEKQDATPTCTEWCNKVREIRRGPQRQTNIPVPGIWLIFLYGSLLIISKDLFLCDHVNGHWIYEQNMLTSKIL